MSFEPVPVFNVDRAFAAAEHLIRGSLERGNGSLTYQGLLSECRADRARIVVSGSDKIETAIVIRFENWGDRVCHVLAIGSDAGTDLLPQFEQLIEYAKPDADRIVFSGRIGWKRKIKELKVTSQNYELEL